MSHPNEQTLRSAYEAFARGDLEGYLGFTFDYLKIFPKKGTMIIKMKDGSKKIIDLSEAEKITVVP